MHRMYGLLVVLLAGLTMAAAALPQGAAAQAPSAAQYQAATPTSTATETATETATATASPTASPTSGTATATTTATAATTTPTTPTATASPTATGSGDRTEPANRFRISFLGVDYNVAGSDTSTWRYRVEELGSANLQSWVLEAHGCSVISADPAPFSVVRPDPGTGIKGVKWPVDAGFTSGEFSVTILGTPQPSRVRLATRSPEVARSTISGPRCQPNDDEEEQEPPARIVVRAPEGDDAPKVEVVNNVTYVITVITIENTGGTSGNVVLVIDLDGSITLADLVFLESQGYVVDLRGTQVVIRLGANNQVGRNAKFKLKLRFKATGDGTSEVRTSIKYHVRVNGKDSEAIVLPVVIPIAVVVAPAPVTVVLPRLTVTQIDVRFRTRWEQDGGLRAIGLPLTLPISLTNGIVVQYFERARFELHPNGQVLLGLLGVELVGVQPPLPPPTSTTTLSATLYVVATGHYMAPQFRSFWTTRGGLALFGYPIGEASVDSRGLLVQYFERARFEYHPDEADAGYRVQLGLLGEEVLVKRGGRPE